MKQFFLIVFAALALLSGFIYWTEPDRASPVPVLYWITANDDMRRETIALFKAWRRDHGLPPVEVKVDTTNADPTKKLAQGLAGVGADLFDIYTSETELFGSSGMLMDVTEPAKKMGFSPAATYPALRTDLLVNGRQYGYPRNVASSVCWINRETFKRYGVPEPSYRWSWDEFEKLGRQFVAAANPPGTRERSYFIQTVSTPLMRRGLGLSIFNETMTHSDLDDPRNAEVMRRYRRWVTELHLIPTPSEQKAMTASGSRASDAFFYLFAKNRYAMLYLPRWALIRLRPLGKMDLRVVEPFNSGFPNMDFSAGFIAAYAGTKHPEEALSFLQFLTSKRFNDLVVRSGDSLPPVPKYVHTEMFSHPPGHEDEWPLQEVFAKAAPEIGISLSRSPFVLSGTLYRPASGIEAQVISSVLAGRLAPEDAGRVESERINDEIAQTIEKDPKMRELYDKLTAVQKKIDQRKAEGRPIPAAWITNPFHLAYYRTRGLLEEESTP